MNSDRIFVFFGKGPSSPRIFLILGEATASEIARKRDAHGLAENKAAVAGVAALPGKCGRSLSGKRFV